MGETRDWLEAHGGPGRTYCPHAQMYVIDDSCEECGAEAAELASQRMKYEELEKRLAHITGLADKELQLLPVDAEPATVERRRFICMQRDVRHALEHWKYQLEGPLSAQALASFMIMMGGDLMATGLIQIKPVTTPVERRTALFRGLNKIFQSMIRTGLIPPDGTPPPRSNLVGPNGQPL